MTAVVNEHYQHTAYLLEVCIDQGIEIKYIDTLNEILLIIFSDNFEEDGTTVDDLVTEIGEILEVLKGESEYLIVSHIVNHYFPTGLRLEVEGKIAVLSGTTTDQFGKKIQYNRRF